MKRISCKGKSVLIISDTHMPYCHRDTFDFLKAIKKKYLNKDSIIIHIGDEVDNHAISFHPNEVELMSAGHELSEATTMLQLLEQTFPKMYLLDSNHGSLAARKMKFNGLPLRYLKSLNEVYGVGTGWSWHDEIIVKTNSGDVYLCHGRSGVYGKLCKEAGSSAIQGHYHSRFEISWHVSSTSERFNMFVGCLVNRESLAFCYGRAHLPKPILGVGLLSPEGSPRLIKMNLNKSGRWNKELE